MTTTARILATLYTSMRRTPARRYGSFLFRGEGCARRKETKRKTSSRPVHSQTAVKPSGRKFWSQRVMGPRRGKKRSSRRRKVTTPFRINSVTFLLTLI